MAKRSQKSLQRIARQIAADEPSKGQIDSPVSVCEYYSREYGVELTVDEGRVVYNFLDTEVLS